MPISARPDRLLALSLVIVLLQACGGGGSGGSSAPGPTSEDQAAASDAFLQSTFDVATHRVTLQWWARFSNTSRYQIEQQDAGGSWVVLDGVWVAQGGESTGLARWTGAISVPTTLRVEAVLPGYTVPLAIQGSQVATSITVAPPTPLPSIAIDQSEPLENPASVSLVNGGSPVDGNSYPSVSYAIDTIDNVFANTLGETPQPTGYPETLNPGTYTTGTHLIYAKLELTSASTVVIGKSVRTHNAKTAIQSAGSSLSTGVFDAYVLATSDAGIASVVGNVDSVPLETLTAPNACVPMPCTAGQTFNAYHLAINTQTLLQIYHSFDAIATDGAGNIVMGAQSSFNLPLPASATLVAPVDGAVVSGTLHLEGTFSSQTPGALELMITLSGNPVYDTTVANTGAEFPYSTDVSLAGFAAGPHTLSVYARVGNTNYTPAASVVIQVTAPP